MVGICIYSVKTDHKCKKCKKSEPEVRFHWRTTKTGKYRRHLCTECYKAYRKKFPKRQSPETSQRYKDKIANWRRLNICVERWILVDSRRADKLRGFVNDLDATFIKNLIKSGCTYCGETQIRMSLDRKDNEQGHTRENVNPCCVRCNMIRRDMPYRAWLVVAKSIKEARETGLFGSWTCDNRKRSTRGLQSPRLALC